MTGTAITTFERKIVAPRIHLKTDPDVLNEYVKKNHKEFRRKTIIEPRRAEKKKKLESKKKVEKFKKDFQKLTEPRKKSVLQKDNEERCTTIQLARILDFLIENKGCEKRIRDIFDFTSLPNKAINKGLKFLVRYNIIKEINNRGWYFYVYE